MRKISSNWWIKTARGEDNEAEAIKPGKLKTMPTSPLNVVIQHLLADLRLDRGGVTDGELLARFLRSRDEGALAILVRRHALMVWGVCRRLLNHHDAEDAFQATFLVLVRKAPDVPRQAVANWLYGVARQTAVRLRAIAAKRGRREAQVVNMPEPTGPEVRDADLQAVLDEELNRLPDHYRGVIVLCDLEGMTRKEAARQLAIPEGSVASRLARARVLLAKRLVQRGVVFSGGSVAVVLSAGSASASASPALVASTIKAASLFAAGQAAATSVISAQVVALTEGVLKTMLLTKLKTVSVLVVAVALLGWGGGALIWQTEAKAQSRDIPAAKSAPAPQQADELTKTLLALDKQLWDAAGSGDWKVYDRLLANDYAGYSPVSGRSDKRGTVEDVKIRRFSEGTIRDVETKEISKDVAILMYVYSCKVTSVAFGTVEKYQDRRTSQVWARRDGAWVLVFCQDSADTKATQIAEPLKR
ncbi:MAG TPA: sigma-70 family RNA polymerase sigma factor [Gemmataceae bacterium]|nr:sigma-70 family RNA polymerase sigma factor [Gemmataceae bacterium]